MDHNPSLTILHSTFAVYRTFQGRSRHLRSRILIQALTTQRVTSQTDIFVQCFTEDMPSKVTTANPSKR